MFGIQYDRNRSRRRHHASGSRRTGGDRRAGSEETSRLGAAAGGDVGSPCKQTRGKQPSFGNRDHSVGIGCAPNRHRRGQAVEIALVAVRFGATRRRRCSRRRSGPPAGAGIASTVAPPRRLRRRHCAGRLGRAASALRAPSMSPRRRARATGSPVSHAMWRRAARRAPRPMP